MLHMTNIANSPPTSSTLNTSGTSSGEQGLAPPDKKEPTAPSEDKPVIPIGDAGVFDVDPDQTDVDQDSETAITGDIDSFPLDMEP